MSFYFHGEVRGREYNGGRGMRTTIGVSNLQGDDEFSWCFLTCRSGIGK
jgi:hypothetical protein